MAIRDLILARMREDGKSWRDWERKHGVRYEYDSAYGQRRVYSGEQQIGYIAKGGYAANPGRVGVEHYDPNLWTLHSMGGRVLGVFTKMDDLHEWVSQNHNPKPLKEDGKSWRDWEAKHGKGKSGILAPGAAVGLVQRMDSGFSYRVADGYEPRAGYMVSEPGGAVIKFDVASDPAKAAKIVQDFVEQRVSAFAGRGRRYLGGWYDSQTHEIWLDVSWHERTKWAAVQRAHEWDQKAIFDVSHGRVIETGGTGGETQVFEAGNEALRDTRQLVDDVGEGEAGLVYGGSKDAFGQLFEGEEVTLYERTYCRDRLGRFTHCGSGAFLIGLGTKEEPYQTEDVDQAAKMLAQGKYVELHSREQVCTMLDKLAAHVEEAKRLGKKAPNYDLCKVTVQHTNLFCVQSKGIARVAMPQLSGIPLPGSKADKLLKNAAGEVNLGPMFLAHCKALGWGTESVMVRASYLKATQEQLNGVKVAGMANAMRLGKMPAQKDSIFVSHDNYIVDGHHRWAASVAEQIRSRSNVMIKCERINKDIIPILDESLRFALDMGLPQRGLTEGFG
jgi:hypothetical protein